HGGRRLGGQPGEGLFEGHHVGAIRKAVRVLVVLERPRNPTERLTHAFLCSISRSRSCTSTRTRRSRSWSPRAGSFTAGRSPALIQSRTVHLLPPRWAAACVRLTSRGGSDGHTTGTRPRIAASDAAPAGASVCPYL